jgi:asparagine synthase (glutamine-hydrolysing)
MCGICGIIKKENSLINKEVLSKMNDSLIHRGPDEEGFFISGNVGLGMRRLSIIDVERGHQPIFNEDRSVCVVCNGEIYNYTELRDLLEKRGHIFRSKSDVEVITHLYEEKGDDFVADLRGMFAIAIYDLNKKELILARDRLGIKPLYYTLQHGEFLFASELKALLKYPDLDKTISYKALSDYLTLLYVPSPETIFENIYKLPPAYILKFRDGDVNLRQYWELDYSKHRERKSEYYVESLSALLNESVKMHLMSEVPLGAFLSGGLDSSTIVALMSCCSSTPVKTFSVGFGVAGFNELKYANLVAEKFNTEHHEINISPEVISLLPNVVRHFDEPFADSSAVPTYLISEFARRQVTVCLAGDGGDELFAGYGWTRRQKFIEDYRRLPRSLRMIIERTLVNKDYFSDRSNRNFDKFRRFLFDAAMPIEKSFMRRKSCFTETMKRSLLKDNILKKIDNYDSVSQILPYFSNNIENNIEKLLFLDTKMYLPDDCLCKVDRMSMFHSLEVRVPFLDHKIVEFVSSLPFSCKMRGISSKYLLKRVMEKDLPRQILKQRKLGFTMPLNRWFRDDLSNYAKQLLNNGCKLSGFINIGYVKWLIKEHNDNNQDFGSQIYALVVLELWLESNQYEDFTN